MNNKDIITLKDYLNLDINKNISVINLFKLLSQLTDSPVLNYDNILSIVNNLNDNHYIYIYKNLDNIPIGIITLIIEQKLIHSGKCVGHIEDLVVDHKYNGKGIASELINYCVQIAKDNNCYKVILDCKEELIPFYNKNNFKKRGICMRLDI